MILLNLLDVNTSRLNLYLHIKINYISFCVPVLPAGMVHNIRHSDVSALTLNVIIYQMKFNV